MGIENSKRTLTQDEREELLSFWEENESLFETLGRRIGEAALSQNTKHLAWYIEYLGKIAALGLSLAQQVHKAEENSAHA